MSKTPQHPSSGGSIRGDVSFIRATSNPSISAGSSSTSIATSNQNIEQLTAQHFVSTSVTSPHSTPENPHQHQHHLHHHQHSQRQHQQQQQLHMQQQPYLPEHMDPQQYMLKQGQGHGAGGASGDSVRLSSHTGVEGWSDREEALAAELDEAKIRVAQMEKTMRWWSDCTSNWREKWNKARNERNKAREENRLLRTKLESLAKELSRLKREKKENALEKDLNPEESLTSTVSNSSKSQEKHSELSEKERSTITGISEKESESVGDSGDLSSLKSRKKEGLHSNTEKDLDDVEIAGGEGSLSSGSTAMTTEVADRLSQLQERQAHLEQELTQALRKASQAAENSLVMQRKLDEANNTVQAERLEKCNHLKTIEILQQQVTDLQESARENEDLRHSLKMEQSTDSERSLEDVLDKVTEQHKQELARLTLDLEDETSSRSTMDRRVTELRRELERIQAENASEWAKRERLESEKLALERDNKKLRSQISDFEEELEKKSQTSSTVADSDLKTMQFELSERTKELADLRHVHSKLKKALTERGTELEHTRRRAEQYEAEVRKLRSRVDELKQDLAKAEDEVDNQGNAARKTQRANDELQAQVESLQVQVSHLQSRLRSNSKHGAVTAPRSTSLRSLTLEDSAELADSENDYDDM